jgi:DNA repair exonuclease SbcCD ATPase subunit
VRKLLTAGALLALAAMSSSAFGQAQRSGGSTAANPQLMQQYQQLSAERTSLKADNERLKKEAEDAKGQLAALKKERDELKARAGGTAAEVENMKKSNAASEQTIADGRRRLDELIQRYKETASTLKSVETDRARLTQELTASGAALDTCVVKNVGLYDLNNEVLTRWENEGFWSRMARSDGFTRLKRTELENLVDGYRARAAELKVKSAAPSTNALGVPAAEPRQRP